MLSADGGGEPKLRRAGLDELLRECRKRRHHVRKGVTREDVQLRKRHRHHRRARRVEAHHERALSKVLSFAQGWILRHSSCPACGRCGFVRARGGGSPARAVTRARPPVRDAHRWYAAHPPRVAEPARPVQTRATVPDLYAQPPLPLSDRTVDAGERSAPLHLHHLFEEGAAAAAAAPASASASDRRAWLILRVLLLHQQHLHDAAADEEETARRLAALDGDIAGQEYLRRHVAHHVEHDARVDPFEHRHLHEQFAVHMEHNFVLERRRQRRGEAREACVDILVPQPHVIVVAAHAVAQVVGELPVSHEIIDGIHVLAEKVLP
mmetsp:Transcript_26010/g.85523  ORF Transcript_26010/g.85523 Transcript_26010/m.85523 type:complete len:323 (-) Transcript_26010:72-1040(-)